MLRCQEFILNTCDNGVSQPSGSGVIFDPIWRCSNCDIWCLEEGWRDISHSHIIVLCTMVMYDDVYIMHPLVHHSLFIYHLWSCNSVSLSFLFVFCDYFIITVDQLQWYHRPHWHRHCAGGKLKHSRHNNERYEDENLSYVGSSGLI